MRVYFSGTASSGKSTLAKYCAKKYNLSFISECARKVLSEKELNLDVLRSNIDIVNEYQMDVMMRQFAEEDKYKDDFVSDRSFDFLGYSANYATNFYDMMQSERLIEYINSLKQKDVIIFFVRFSRDTLKNDGIRETIIEDDLIRIDGQIKLLFELFRLKYYQISMTNMQERIRFIENILDK